MNREQHGLTKANMNYRDHQEVNHWYFPLCWVAEEE